MKLIVSSAALSGAVRITAPDAKFMAAVTQGGFGRIPDPEPEPAAQTTEARQIEAMLASGYDVDFASRYVGALVRGGETNAGALALIKARHLADDLNHQTCEPDELPADRWFRDAWRQDRDTGKVSVDLDAARLVFARRLIEAKASGIEALVREVDVITLAGSRDTALEAAQQSLKAIDLAALAVSIAEAETPEALRALWPAALGNA